MFMDIPIFGMDESLKIQTTVERRLNGQYDTEMAK
jgi:hypothetical protein